MPRARRLVALLLVLTACGGSQPRPSAPDASPLDTLDAAADRDADTIADVSEAGEVAPEVSSPALACARPPAFRGAFGPDRALSIGEGRVQRVATDAEGRTVVAGLTWTQASVGEHPTPDPASEGPRPFVLVLGNDGREIWSRVFTGRGSLGDMAVSAAGEIYLVGATANGPAAGRLDLGAGPLAGDLFLAKLGRDGTVAWQRGFSDPDESHLPASVQDFTLAVASDGSVALAADLHHGIDFGGGRSADGGTSDSLVVWDRDGQHRFTRRSFTPSVSRVSIAFDSTGHLLVTGTRGDGDLFVVGGREPSGFLTKVDPAGVTVWERELGLWASTVAVATAGTDVYVAGDFSGTLTVEPGGRAAVGTKDAFIAKLGADGASKAVITRPTVTGGLFALAAHPMGGMVLAGRAGETLDLAGNVALPGDHFVAHLGDDGVVIASALLRDPSTLFMTADGAGNVAVAGDFVDAIDLGTGPLPNPARSAGSAMFVARIGRLPRVATAPVPCAAPPQLFTGPPESGSTPLTWGYGRPTYVALTSDAVFYATATDVHEVPRQGGAANVRALGLRTVSGFHADQTGVVWSDAGTTAERRDGNVMALPLAAGAPQALLTGLSSPRGLVVEGDTVYFLADGKLPEEKTELWALPRAGGSPRLMASGLVTPGPLAAYKGEVVLAFTGVSGGRALMRVRSNGDRTVILDAGNPRAITALSFDDSTVFFTEGDSSLGGGPTGNGTSGDGRLSAIPLTGGMPVVRATSLPNPRGILRVGDDVIAWYYGTGGGSAIGNAVSLPAAGGAATYLLGGRPYLLGFAADAKGLAWIEAPGGWTLYTRPR